jgi:magnesium-transporting ATPase (P-type)
MSVVCRCVPHGSRGSSSSLLSTTSNTSSNTTSNASVAHYSPDEEWYCLVKGSPEALKPLLVADSAPSWYSSTYEALARKGLRVLALAYKKVSAKELGVQPPATRDAHRGNE